MHLISICSPENEAEREQRKHRLYFVKFYQQLPFKLLSSACQQILPRVSIAKPEAGAFREAARLVSLPESQQELHRERALPRNIRSAIILLPGSGALKTSPLHANAASRHGPLHVQLQEGVSLR